MTKITETLYDKSEVTPLNLKETEKIIAFGDGVFQLSEMNSGETGYDELKELLTITVLMTDPQILHDAISSYKKDKQLRHYGAENMKAELFAVKTAFDQTNTFKGDEPYNTEPERFIKVYHRISNFAALGFITGIPPAE